MNRYGRRRDLLHPLVFLLSLLAASCAAGPRLATPYPGPHRLASVLDSIISTPPLDRTHWGIEIYDPATRRVLYAHNPEGHFIAASNTKLVVTTVALGELGADFRYRTELYAIEPAGDTAQIEEAAGLLLVARGDPTLSRRFHPDGPTPLEALADSVAASGLRRVLGDLVIDVAYFDSRPIHPAWEVGDLAYYYAAPVAAFAVEEGTFPVVLVPGDSVGAPARVVPLAPAGTIALEAAIATEAAGTRRRVRAQRAYLSDAIELTGTLPLGTTADTLFLAAPYPAELAAREFLAALATRGVVVEGAVRVVGAAAEAALVPGTLPDATPRADGAATPRPLATWHSPPLIEIVEAILKPSQNWIAEQLIKTVGAERGAGGSWREGLKVERQYLLDVVGIDSTAIWLSDGSGLSAKNLLTPHAIVQLLKFARRQPWGTRYRDALAVPGESGTLEGRLMELRGRLHAKTGTMTHVNSLSGYLRTNQGRLLTFSIMADDSGLPAATVRQAIDQMVRAMAEAL